MPVGKNSIKRVANNGYARIESKAPDMENSVVAPAETKTAEKAEAKPAAKKTTAAKKQTTEKKKPAAKKTETKPAEAKVTEAKITEEMPSEKREGAGYTNLGGNLPVYLL